MHIKLKSDYPVIHPIDFTDPDIDKFNKLDLVWQPQSKFDYITITRLLVKTPQLEQKLVTTKNDIGKLQNYIHDEK